MRLGLVDNLIMAGLAINKHKCAVVLLDSKSKFCGKLIFSLRHCGHKE